MWPQTAVAGLCGFVASVAGHGAGGTEGRRAVDGIVCP